MTPANWEHSLEAFLHGVLLPRASVSFRRKLKRDNGSYTHRTRFPIGMPNDDLSTLVTLCGFKSHRDRQEDNLMIFIFKIGLEYDASAKQAMMRGRWVG
jgi:hypothetical protein